MFWVVLLLLPDTVLAPLGTFLSKKIWVKLVSSLGMWARVPTFLSLWSLHPPDLWKPPLTPAWGAKPPWSSSLHHVHLSMIARQEAAPRLHEPLSLYFCWCSSLTPGWNRICLKPPQKLLGTMSQREGYCLPGKHISHPWWAPFCALLSHFPQELLWSPDWSFPRVQSLTQIKKFLLDTQNSSLVSTKMFVAPCPTDLPLLLHPSLLSSPITLHFFSFLLCWFLRPLTVALNCQRTYACNTATISRNQVLSKPWRSTLLSLHFFYVCLHVKKQELTGSVRSSFHHHVYYVGATKLRNPPTDPSSEKPPYCPLYKVAK